MCRHGGALSIHPLSTVVEVVIRLRIRSGSYLLWRLRLVFAVRVFMILSISWHLRSSCLLTGTLPCILYLHWLLLQPQPLDLGLEYLQSLLNIDCQLFECCSSGRREYRCVSALRNVYLPRPTWLNSVDELSPYWDVFKPLNQAPEAFIQATAYLSTCGGYLDFHGILRTLARVVPPVATAFLPRLAAEVAELATACVDDVVTCVWEVADALGRTGRSGIPYHGRFR
jgi:hypothetical protein